MRVYCGVGQDSPISRFLFNLVLDELREDVLRDLRDVGVKLRKDMKMCDLRYADDSVLVSIRRQCTTRYRHKLEACRSARHELLTSDCKLLLLDWPTAVLKSILDEEQLTSVDDYTIFGNCMKKEGNQPLEVNTNISRYLAT